jgi:kynurenine formamidase
MTIETLEMDKKQVVETPKDIILDGVVIHVTKTTWRNIIDEHKLIKFDEPDQEIVNIEFEVKFQDKVLKGNDTIKYYEIPMSNSKLGKYLIKYDKLKVGQTIKVEYSGDGFPSIKIK